MSDKLQFVGAPNSVTKSQVLNTIHGSDTRFDKLKFVGPASLNCDRSFLRRRFFGRQLQEDVFQTQAHGSQFKQLETTSDYRGRELASKINSRFAFHDCLQVIRVLDCFKIDLGDSFDPVDGFAQ